jgi:DNA-binding response OmpR family regulator
MDLQATSPRPRILLAEDEEMIRRSLAFGLSRAGYQADGFANGQLAYDAFLARKGQYDLVITDVQMPLMDGMELVQRLKETHPDLPILVMTGYGEGELEGRLESLGNCQIVGKPFRLDDLMERIRLLIA